MHHKVFLFLLLSFLHITKQGYIPIYDIIGNLSTLNVPVEEDNYYESIIDTLIEIMKNYAYIDIIKSPLNKSGSYYSLEVDIIQELKNLREKVKNTPPKFYKFYQDVLKIIDKAKDYHILFGYLDKKGKYSLLNNLIICQPIEFDFQRDKSVLVKPNNLINILGNNKVQVENYEKINENYNNKIYVKEINGDNVYNFIRKFCYEYIQFKSPSAKFIYNRENIKSIALWQCPLNPEEFKNFNITYSNGETISSNYIGFLNTNNKTENDNIINSFRNSEIDHILNYNNFESKIDENNLVTWDINIDNHIKCKVDHDKKVNVIYQNSFKPDNSDPLGIIKNISYCHGNFSSNDYPLIVIESLNGGGYAQLSKLMQQLVQDLMKPKNYFSIIHNENTYKFLRDNKDSFLFVDDEEKRNLTIYEFYKDKINDNMGNRTIERSKQKLLLDLNFESNIVENIFKRNITRKPTDVIVFTDGLSFSSTSVFIKNLYYFGGAILVGYGGDPEVDTFDASQSPTFVLTNLTGIKGYFDLIKKGFYFLQLPTGPMYRTKYDEKNEDIPEEFVINYIDERVNIYNVYSDNLYDDFIEEAKKIFDKYKDECNKNNKYLKLIKNECKFEDPNLHGGYICDEEGHWAENCIPFYCDEDYYFDYNSKKCVLLNKEIEEIPLDTIQSFSIKIKNKFNFKFSPDNNDGDLIVNIHSINCNIKINRNNDLNIDNIKNKYNDTFSFRIKSDEIGNANFTITPLIYLNDEREKKNYKSKTCPIIITNFKNKKEEIPKLELTDTTNLFFDEDFKEINFSYEIKNINSDSPIALSIQLSQNSEFEISAKLKGKDNNFINRRFSNSTNIFFDREFQEGEKLEINIRHIDEKMPIFANIKIIKKTSVSILDQNNLNFGFISSKIELQYYYMEVFKDQEGEIMLHSKREKGILFAKLYEINSANDPNDINLYPKDELDSSLNYNQHILKLNFSYEDTSICDNGCYLLISFYHEINNDIDKNFSIGYEYTILSRVWDYLEYSSQIVNIPFNEYIIGSFEQGSITEHYYSIFIPNDTDKILIQLEGNYLDGFIGEGISKLNTIKSLDNIKNLNILNSSNIFVLTKNDSKFNFQNKYISLALRSKNYFEEIFSFYTFRIFYLKENDILFYPADSDFVNTCLPEKENGKYYCNVILRNNYNEINNDFSIMGENQIEYFKVYTSVYHKNNSLIDSKYHDFKYIYMNGKNNTSNDSYKDAYNNSEVGHYIFRFEFNEGGIKNIISSFSYKSKEHFPQIYTSRMYFIFDMDLYFNYSLVYNYTLVYKWLSGWVGDMKLNLPGFENNIYSSRNFRGKPIALQVSNKQTFMVFTVSNKEFIFYYKLNYNMKNKGIEEIISSETRSEIINYAHFPLYYYINLRKKEDINIDINIRINSYNFLELKNDFEIKGYILNEDLIKRKIKGEYIVLKEEEALQGTYYEWFGFGLLQLKAKSVKDADYLLITINNNVKSIINNTYVLIEMVVKEYFEKDEEYFMPINQYMIETFEINENSTRDINKYYIDVNERYNYRFKNDSDVMIEFSSNYDDIKLNIDNNTDFKYIPFIVGGAQKFRITQIEKGPIHFNVSNPHKRTKGNYIIRYYYTDFIYEYIYSFDTNNFNYHIDISNNDNLSFSITFNNINITSSYETFDPAIEGYNITFYVYAFLYPKNSSCEELVNTSSLVYDRQYLYKSQTKSIYFYDKNISLKFSNISREHNYVYDLVLKINAFVDHNLLNEEFLVYTVDLNLTDIGIKPESMSELTIVLLTIGGIILVIILVIVFFIVYRKLKRDNTKLEEKVISIDFDTEVQKKVLKKEIEKYKGEELETNFI